jgi:CBS domain-containing protein
MTVQAILDRKGRDVVTIDPAATLEDASKLMCQRGIGAVLVIGPEGGLDGLLSERDIVRALSTRGAAVLASRVGEMMTRKVVTCTSGETVATIMERMTAGKFRHVPVVENGRMVGIISIGDVVKHRLQEIERESDALREYILTA